MFLVSRVFTRAPQVKHLLCDRPLIFSETIKNCTKMSTSALPAFEHLAVTVPKEYVFQVELNRADKLNAMNATMFAEIKQCFDLLSGHEDCRSVVLTGAGRLFTAGIDLQTLVQTGSGVAKVDDPVRKAKAFLYHLRRFQESMSSLEVCRKPVIAAVHNGCIGAGANLVSFADIRYCTKDAYFVVKEIDMGLAPDLGALQKLPKIIGSDSTAREIIYTCRKVLAPEALALGLVSRVFDNKEELVQNAINLAEEIAKKSPVAVQTAKLNLVYSKDHTTQEGLDHLALLNQLMLQSEDLMIAITAQMSKSPPTFSKL